MGYYTILKYFMPLPILYHYEAFLSLSVFHKMSKNMAAYGKVLSDAQVCFRFV